MNQNRVNHSKNLTPGGDKKSKTGIESNQAQVVQPTLDQAKDGQPARGSSSSPGLVNQPDAGKPARGL